MASIQSDTENPAKRMRTNGAAPAKSTEQILFESLLGIWGMATTTARDKLPNIEVEVRVGMLGDHGVRTVHAAPTSYASIVHGRPAFTSGIDESLAEKVRDILCSRGYAASVQPAQRLRFDAAGDFRVDMGSSGETASRCEQKRKICRIDVGLPSSFYDIRLDTVVEEDISKSFVDAKFVWHTERLKRRSSFISDKPCFWRVDLTEVQTITNGGSTNNSDIELEFEMLNGPMVQWLSCSEDKVAAETTKVMVELHGLLRALIPGQKESGPHGAAPKRPDARAKENIEERVRVLRSGRGLNFLGSMPINLTRRNFAAVRRSNYFITEKSDGLRYLLFVVIGGEAGSASPPGPIAVLMDRSGELSLMPGSAVIGEALGVGTVLDGRFEMLLRVDT